MMKELWKEYLERLGKGDAEGLVALFTKDGVFDDSARKLLGYRENCIVGSAAIKSFFEELFAKHQVRVEAITQFGHKQFYNVHVDEVTSLNVVGTITQRDGLIEYLEVRFRQ